MSRGGFPTRRHVLSTLYVSVASALTGCFSPQMGGPVAEISVHNATESEVEVRLQVYQGEDERPLVTDTFTLAAGSGREYEQPFSRDGRKRLEIVIDGTRRASYEWDARAERDSTGVDITVREDHVDIDEVGR